MLVPVMVGCLLATAYGADEVLIDASFKPGSPPSKSENLADLIVPHEPPPLNAPSAVGVTNPSTLKVGSIRNKTPEFGAIFDVQQFEGMDGVAANTLARWDLRTLGLGAGIYELTYEVSMLSEPAQGANLQFDFVGPEGKPIDVPIHPSQCVRVGVDSKSNFRVRAKATAIGADSTLHIKIILDMDKHVWSAFLDDEMQMENLPIAPALLEAEPNPCIGAILFGSAGGLGDKAPFKYALTKLRLVRKGN